MRTAKSREPDAPDAAPRRAPEAEDARRAAPGRSLQRTVGNWAYAGWIQAQREPGAGEPLDTAARRVGAAPARARDFVVSDAAETVGSAQMRKQAFLEALRARVCEVAEAELAGTGRSTDGCSYLDTWFDYYADRDPEHIESVVRRYAPAARSATSAAAYIDVITDRVRQGVRRWVQTGEVAGVPADLQAAGGMAPAAEGAASRASGGARDEASEEEPTVQRKGGSDTEPPPSTRAAQRIQAQMGTGRPLPAGVRSRMEGILGAYFSGVRIHTAPPAAEIARQLRARAFTVGHDVAFAPGEFAPGTVSGDLLLAHELAHVEQQRQAVSAPPSDSSTEAERVLEDDADRTAAGAVAALWGRATGWVRATARRTRPRLRSGLRLQRCSVDYSVEDRARLIHRELSKDPEEMDPDRIVRYVEDLTPDEIDRLKKVYREEHSESRGGRGLLDDLQFGMLGPGRTSVFGGGAIRQENVVELYRTHAALGGNIVRQDAPTPSGPDGIVVDPSDPEVLPGVPVTYRLQKRPSLPAVTAIQWVVRNDPDVEALPAYVTGPRGSDWEEAEWSYPGRHQVICMVRFGSGEASGVRFYQYEQVVRDIRELAREEFAGDLEKQPRNARREQAQFEKIADEARQAATDVGVSEDVVQAYGHALTTVIEVETHLQDEDDIPATLASRAKTALGDFVDTFRDEVRSFDETEVRHFRRGAGEYTVRTTENPYLSPSAYRYYSRRLERDRASWAQKLQIFYTVVQKMDGYLQARLQQTGRAEQAERLGYAGRLSTEIGELHARHPDAQRIRAVFFPERQRLENQGSAENPEYDLKQVRLNFYTYREEGEWHLADLTTPDEPIVSSEEGGTVSSPPLELFEELNTRLRFPKGALFWELSDGTRYSMRTTEPWSLSDWLTAVGLGLAAAAIVVGTAGFGTPATVLIVGSGIVGAAAATADIAERADVGRLTTRDIVIDVASIVASLGSAGTVAMGRIAVTGAMQTGRYARLAVMADRYYLPVALTALGGDVITVAAFTASTIDQYERITSSDLPQEQKEVALQRLLQAGLLTGGIAILGFRGQIRDLGRGRTLYLDLDFEQNVIARPTLRPEDLLEYAGRIGAEDNLRRVLATQGVSEDFLRRMRADLTAAIDAPNVHDDDIKAVISDLMKARNRPPGQVQSGMEEALAELRAANRLNFTSPRPPQRIYVGAKQKNEPFTLTDDVAVNITPVSEADLLYFRDGRAVIEEVKNTVSALRRKLSAKPQQLDNMADWRRAASDDLPRTVRVRIEKEDGWTEMFRPIKGGDPASGYTLKKLIDADVPLSIGPYDLPVDRLRSLRDAVKEQLDAGTAPGDLFESMPTLRDAERVLGIDLI